MTTFHQHLPANTVGRDFIVGDLHGCLDLLEAELARIKFEPTKDRLFSVGDLADRGPDSMGCLRLLHELSNVNYLGRCASINLAG